VAKKLVFCPIKQKKSAKSFKPILLLRKIEISVYIEKKKLKKKIANFFSLGFY